MVQTFWHIKRKRKEGGINMDLDEYRRIYMTMEGVNNTPLNAVKRFLRLGKSIKAFPEGVKKDVKEREDKKFYRSLAKDKIKNNGLSYSNAKEYAKNLPWGNKHTMEAASRVGRSASAVGRSVNELGSTTRSIVGTNRANPYDGQDLEQGVRFAMTAYSIIGKGLRLPPNMAKAAFSIGHFGVMSVQHVGSEIGIKKQVWKEKRMEKDFDYER